MYEGQINRCPSRYFCPKLYIHVLTMAAAFQVILEDEGDNRPRLKQPRVLRDRYICFTIMFFTDLHLYCLSVSGLEAYLSPSPNTWLYLSPHGCVRKLLLLISITIYGIVVGIVEKTFQYRSARTDAHKCSMVIVAVFMISITPTAKVIQRQNVGFKVRKTGRIRNRYNQEPHQMGK